MKIMFWNRCEKILMLSILLLLFYDCIKKNKLVKDSDNIEINTNIALKKDTTFEQKNANFKECETIFKEFINNYSDKYLIKKSTSNFAHILKNNTEYLNCDAVQLKQRIPFKNKYNQIAYQRIDCFFFEYKSESKCSAAIDSLFNCFPYECQKLPKEQNIKTLKTTPSIFVLNDTYIVLAAIGCEHDNEDWHDFKIKMIKFFSMPNSKILSTECGGPLEWLH